METHSCYKIGYVAKTHGLKGEVTIVLDPAVPALLASQSLFIEIKNSLIPYFIEHISDRGDKAFVKFDEIDTPEAAKQLKGCSLYLPKKARAKLKQGEFYNDEVVGFEVVDEKSGVLGTIREILEIGPNRLVAVDRAAGEILIPVNGPFIQEINRSKKKFKVDLPEGFLDI